MNRSICRPFVIATALAAGACGHSAVPLAEPDAGKSTLVGAWRSQIHFDSGAFAEVKDLEFMIVFNAGGTMTESSNYDAAPPVPPAYGIWRSTGPRRFEARYAFYATKAPATFEDVAKGGGWSPAGHGVLTEKITLSDDGQSYSSTVVYTAFDAAGHPAEGGGEGTSAGTRMVF
jgi:hypothetical protein